jgi:RNA recognition motif-containing protein
VRLTLCGHVQEIVSALGKLSGYTLVKDIFTGQPKGFAFFCYADENITPIAIQTFNGMEVSVRPA